MCASGRTPSLYVRGLVEHGRRKNFCPTLFRRGGGVTRYESLGQFLAYSPCGDPALLVRAWTNSPSGVPGWPSSPRSGVFGPQTTFSVLLRTGKRDRLPFRLGLLPSLQGSYCHRDHGTLIGVVRGVETFHRIWQNVN